MKILKEGEKNKDSQNHNWWNGIIVNCSCGFKGKLESNDHVEYTRPRTMNPKAIIRLEVSCPTCARMVTVDIEQGKLKF